MLVESLIERTTAATDLILAIQSLATVVLLQRSGFKRPMWTGIWTAVFALLAVASGLGAVSHGLVLPARLQTAIWIVIFLALGLMMALFAIVAISFRWNAQLARRCLPFALIVGFCFFAVTQIWSDLFLLFIVYQTVTMLFALALYAGCSWTRRASGAGILAAGILVSIFAAVVDTQQSLRVHVVRDFNNHGVFHLVQMVSSLLLMIGLHHSHREVVAMPEAELLPASAIK